MVLHRIGSEMWTARVNGITFTGTYDSAVRQAFNSIS